MGLGTGSAVPDGTDGYGGTRIPRNEFLGYSQSSLTGLMAMAELASPGMNSWAILNRP